MDVKTRLFIDLETYSSIDIASAGAFRYMEAPDFQILLLAYAWNSDPVHVVNMLDAPNEARAVLEALTDPDVIKIAHNAAFERAALRVYTGVYQPPEQWEDTMILSAMNGLPMSLDAVGAALGLKDQKIKEGTSLINYFCRPCKPTIANGGRSRNLPRHAPDKWYRFVSYCKRDVEVAQAIYYRLPGPMVPEWEKRLRCIDARINERGILIDRELVEAAVAVDSESRSRSMTELRNVTGVENPGSVSQLQKWLGEFGYYPNGLSKAEVAELIPKTSGDVRRALELRQLLGKTSTKKYDAMLAAASPTDDRIRGTMQYYGAGKTGRWAGRLIQVQNLPQNHLDRIGEVRELVRHRDLEALEMLYDSTPDVLSQLIRTAIIAKPEHTFLVADYSAIEARVIAYLAGVKWRQEVFANGGDIYCSSASQMFKVPVEKHGVNSHLRQKGKIAELACGYGGGKNALINFGADKMGLTDDEMQQIVTQWRAASPEIPRMWRDVEQAAKNAILSPGKPFRTGCGCLYWKDKDALRLRLPSGRTLSYWGAHMVEDSICFWSQNQTTRKWETTGTWGGKLVENIVQAYARDCLAVAMIRLEDAGYNICFSVHDELISEEQEDGRGWKDMADIMGLPIDWAPGLLLKAEGYSTKFYMKD